LKKKKHFAIEIARWALALVLLLVLLLVMLNISKAKRQFL